MKDGIHPKYNPVVFVDTSNGTEFITMSTASSKESREIDGVKHFVINCEVTSESHPHWTGKVHRLDTAGRIERFEKKFTSIDTGKRKTRKKEVKKTED